MIDYALIISKHYPEANWYILGDDYSGLEWLDDSPKPSKSELDALWPDILYEAEYELVERERRVAYQLEADPIFFQAQRGKKTEKEWLDKIKEIDERFPYPVKESKK